MRNREDFMDRKKMYIISLIGVVLIFIGLLISYLHSMDLGLMIFFIGAILAIISAFYFRFVGLKLWIKNSKKSES
jgi:uncharacterized protein YacL